MRAPDVASVLQMMTLVASEGYAVLANALAGDLGALVRSVMWNACGGVITLFLLYKVAVGKDWARQILLNLMLLGFMVGLLFTLFSGLGTWADGLVAASVRVLEIVSIVLLYLPVSNRWFDAASG